MRTLAISVLLAIWVGGCSSKSEQPPKPTPAPAPDGQAIATSYCVSCHLPPGATAKNDAGVDPDMLAPPRPTPTLEDLRRLPPAAIVISLEHGAMRDIGATLAPAQRIAVAEYLGGGKYEPTGATAHYCKPEKVNADALLAGPTWTGGGNDLGGTRFQPSDVAKLAVTDIGRLAPKWSLALAPGRAGSSVTVAGSRMYFGDQAGKVRSVDLRTGCTHWIFDAGRWVRTAVNLQRDGDRVLACFGATQFPDAHFCVDASTGAKVWDADLVEHAMAYTSTSAALHEGVLYVPISAGRESHRGASDPKYECCTGRGAVVAVDVMTGKVKWRTFTTPEPQRTQKSEAGTQMWGPSGASVWKPPVVDPVLGRLYVTTGQNSTLPATKTSDAVLAIDMKTGKIVWSRQFTKNDVWNGSCDKPDGSGGKGNCPFTPLSGLDPSTPLLTARPGGGRILVVGDKTGRVVGLDPDREGAVLWDKKLSAGGRNGGVQWGMAADAVHVYVPLHDRFGFEGMKSTVGMLSGGTLKPTAGALVALRLSNGDEVWRKSGADDSCAAKAKTCSKAFSSPPAVIPGAVFAGSLDGHVRAFATSDGALLWDFDTAREFVTIDGNKATGGAVDGPGGITVVDGTVIVSSGYGAYYSMPGNVLLAFTVDGK